MSALARKWRPKDFSELIGHDLVKVALGNALTQQRLHHAYLFTGTRGVGKTSIARLFAKSLICLEGISLNPCLKCANCVAIENGQSIDLIEIDGASNTKVEDTRLLLNNTQYLPVASRYKIYIIDEVHMLSNHSFNALLKTLEEPPAHIIFLLATTEPEKLPITVLSRCLQFHLKNLTELEISTQINSIVQAEGFSIEDEAATLISEAAHGSMRDALSLLDQIILCCTETFISSKITKSTLGYTQTDFAETILIAILQKDANQLIQISHQILTEGGNYQYVCEQLIQHIHKLQLALFVKDRSFIKLSTLLESHTQFFTSELLQLLYEILMQGHHSITFAPTMQIGFEMLLLRMLAFNISLDHKHCISHETSNVVDSPSASAKPIIQTVNTLQSTNTIVTDPIITLNQTPFDSIDKTVDTSSYIENATEAITEVIRNPIKLPIKQMHESHSGAENMSGDTSNNISTQNENARLNSIPNTNEEWYRLIKKIPLTGIAKNAIENASLDSADGNLLYLKTQKGHDTLFSAMTIQKIELALSTYFQSPIKIHISATLDAPITPASIHKEIKHSEKSHAIQQLEADDFVQTLKETFAADLIKESVETLKTEV
jgi:DNA polymerase-3 subunit gamma/tau